MHFCESDVDGHFHGSDGEELMQFGGRAGTLPQLFARVRRVSGKDEERCAKKNGLSKDAREVRRL